MNPHSFSKQILVRQEKNHIAFGHCNSQKLPLSVYFHIASGPLLADAKITVFQSLPKPAPICLLDN